jgi:hypothetical protein
MATRQPKLTGDRAVGSKIVGHESAAIVGPKYLTQRRTVS